MKKNAFAVFALITFEPAFSALCWFVRSFVHVYVLIVALKQHTKIFGKINVRGHYFCQNSLEIFTLVHFTMAC